MNWKSGTESNDDMTVFLYKRVGKPMCELFNENVQFLY